MILKIVNFDYLIGKIKLNKMIIGQTIEDLLQQIQENISKTEFKPSSSI